MSDGVEVSEILDRYERAIRERGEAVADKLVALAKLAETQAQCRNERAHVEKLGEEIGRLKADASVRFHEEHSREALVAVKKSLKKTAAKSKRKK